MVGVLALCDLEVLARDDPVDAEGTGGALGTHVSSREYNHRVADRSPFDIGRSGRWL